MNTKPSRALEYLTEAKEIAKKYDYKFVLSDIYQNIGTIHYRKNEFDSALKTILTRLSRVNLFLQQKNINGLSQSWRFLY